MTTPPAGPRPSVVTWGAGAGVVAGALLVATAFDALHGMGSLAAAGFVSDWKRLGGTEESLRAVYIGVGAGAGLVAVLAAYAAFGSRPARAALAPVAAVVFVMTMFLQWTLGVGIAAMLGLLWSPPARDWYAGRAPRPSPARDGPESRDAPRFESFGARRTRPRAVTVAVLLTLVLASMSIASGVYEGLRIATSASYLAQFEQRFPGLGQVPHADNLIRAAAVVGAVFGVLLALVEIVLAIFVFQGNHVARLMLMVFAGVAIAVSVLSLPLGLIVMAPWVLVLALLYSPEAKAWFEQIRRERASR